ncbi:hypothetical protein AB0I81_11140 [Nonomuraea sp. NPDC050404]|uniref:hypothetical protein n=1 Tax=Nonomuraea sp. NPDC050404 TaxID=3155783 RepID=UPI0033EB8214
MSNSLPKVASLALLAGALLLPAIPASAATATTAAVKADEPFSTFDVTVKAPKKVKAGAKITYTIYATNKGPHYADAWFIGGEFPKGVDLKRIRFGTTVKGTECALDGRAFFCLAPKVVEKGESVAMAFTTKVDKKAKGTLTAKLGVVAYSADQGFENMSKEELDRLGVPVHGFVKTAKTKVVR